jgi:hypothetical protein
VGRPSRVINRNVRFPDTGLSIAIAALPKGPRADTMLTSPKATLDSCGALLTALKDHHGPDALITLISDGTGTRADIGG